MNDQPATSAESNDPTNTMALRAGVDPAELDVPEGVGIEAGALEALGSGTALLVVSHGPNAGSRFLLDADTVTVGRHPDSEIFLDDITVSRRHAQFARTDSAFSVSDVGSLNGTYVNRQRVDQAELVGGDEVQIGKYRLIFHPAAGV
jgi:pSer/pThr/pTyr-binding forkhead associated (FHA) protein